MNASVRWIFPATLNAAILVGLLFSSPAQAETYVVTRDTDLRTLGLHGHQRLTVVTRDTDLQALEIERLERRLEHRNLDAAVRRLDAQIAATNLEITFWERQAAEFYHFNHYLVDSKPFTGFEDKSRLELGLARIRLSELEAERRLIMDQRDAHRLRQLSSARQSR